MKPDFKVNRAGDRADVVMVALYKGFWSVFLPNCMIVVCVEQEAAIEYASGWMSHRDGTTLVITETERLLPVSVEDRESLLSLVKGRYAGGIESGGVSMVFECIDEFTVPVVDENGLPLEESNFVLVRKGSLWELDTDTITLTGAEVRLNESSGLSWIEVSKERIRQCFVVEECKEECRTKGVTSCEYWDTAVCKLHRQVLSVQDGGG